MSGPEDEPVLTRPCDTAPRTPPVASSMREKLRSVPVHVLAGIGLVGLAGFLIFGGGSFEARRAKRTAEGIPFFKPEHHPVKPWVGGGALVAGVVLLVFRKQPPRDQPDEKPEP